MNCANKDEEGMALGHFASLHLHSNRHGKEQSTVYKNKTVGSSSPIFLDDGGEVVFSFSRQYSSFP